MPPLSPNVEVVVYDMSCGPMNTLKTHRKWTKKLKITPIKARWWGVSYMFISKAGHTEHVPGYMQVRNKASQQVRKCSQMHADINVANIKLHASDRRKLFPVRNLYATGVPRWPQVARRSSCAPGGAALKGPMILIDGKYHWYVLIDGKYFPL